MKPLPVLVAEWLSQGYVVVLRKQDGKIVPTAMSAEQYADVIKCIEPLHHTHK